MLNAIFTNCSTIGIQVPSGTAPGDPVIVGGVKGVAEAVFNSAGNPVSVTTDGDGFATLRIKPTSVFNSNVLASTDSTSSPLGGASAVALGDTLYKTDSAETLSKDTSGTAAIGFALGTRNAYGFYATGTQLAAGSTDEMDWMLS